MLGAYVSRDLRVVAPSGPVAPYYCSGYVDRYLDFLHVARSHTGV